MAVKKQRPNHSKKNKIPKFANRQEMAEWWDTHDVTDYLDELEPVELRFADDFKSEYRETKPHLEVSRRPQKSLTIRFPIDVIAELRQRATRKGIGATTLARMWILEHLENKKTSASKTTYQHVGSK